MDGIWQGYFTLKDEILYSPEDKRCPYSLVFDTRTWVDMKPVKTKRFRGFTYNTPEPEDVITLPRQGERRDGEGGSNDDR